MQIESVASHLRERDLARAVEDGDEHLFALGAVTIDVLDLDRRIIDEHPDDERETAQGHEVEPICPVSSEARRCRRGGSSGSKCRR